MAGESRRVFVGNLPHEVTRNDVVEKFKKYGNVESVEIKTKRDTSTDEVLATFCYVNLKTDSHTLDSCIHFLNGIKWNGRHIKVEAAKESFLQRLQRERQSSQQTSSPKSHVERGSPKTPESTIVNFKSLDNKVLHSKKKQKEKQVTVLSESDESGAESGKLQNEVQPVLKETSAKKTKPELKKCPSSSESSDSDNESTVLHPTNKLSMFRGMSSLLSSSISTQQESRSKDDSEGKVSLTRSMTSKNHFGKTESHSNSSIDMLKKFESFSDVWKDADEPTDVRQTSVQRHTKAVRNNFSSGVHSIENSNSFEKRPWEIQGPEGVSKKRNLQESMLASNLVNVAEEKRLKSLEVKRQAFEEQKKAVQLALSDKGAHRMNKKIVFGDESNYEDEQISAPKQIQKRKDSEENVKKVIGKSLRLFDESDDESAADKWDGEFHVKKQFEGEKGKKLLELQTRYNNDNRFKLDERFYDSDNEDDPSKGDSSTSKQGEGIEGLAEEREQQLQILSSVLGRPIPISQPPSHHENKTKGMLRFDPLKPQHSRYVITKEPQEKKKKKKTKLNRLENGGEEEEEEEDEEESIKPKVRREEKEPEPVSQNKFYSVSDTLAESLKLAKEGHASGFSLLQMFGSSHVPKVSESKDNPKDMSKTEKLKTRVLLDNSSSEDEESDHEGPTAFVDNSTLSLAANSANSRVKSTGGFWQESFFFQPNDNRLKEGAQFFSQIEDSSDTTKFSKKRQELRHIVKLKLRNSSRKANSFKTKVGALRKKASLWPSPRNRVQKPRQRPKY